MAIGIRTLKNIVSEDKVVEQTLLNLFGVQVLRTLAARVIYNLRSVPEDGIVQEKIDELKREGIIVLHNFLAVDHFERTRQECQRLLDEKPDKLPNLRFGMSMLVRSKVFSLTENELPNIYRFLSNPEIHAILEAVEKRSMDYCLSSGRPEIQRLTQHGSRDEKDPETELHSDIFFNTHKAWLYLTDVEIKDGPLVYVRQSHRLTLTQLRYIYKESREQNTGSRRISVDEFKRLGLQETIVTCPRNTLVIANTCGYHRRLPNQPEGKREALHVHLRANPFTYR